MYLLSIFCLISVAAALPAPTGRAQIDFYAPSTVADNEQIISSLDATSNEFTKNDQNLKQNLKQEREKHDDTNKPQAYDENGYKHEPNQSNDHNLSLKQEKEDSKTSHDEKDLIDQPKETNTFDQKSKEEKKDSNTFPDNYKKNHTDAPKDYYISDQKSVDPKKDPKPEENKNEKDDGKNENDVQPLVPVLIKIEESNTRVPILSIISWLYCHWPSFELSINNNEPQDRVRKFFVADIAY